MNEQASHNPPQETRSPLRWLARPKLYLALLLILFAVTLIRTAWMSDDAYITLRTVDNFTHGRGLTWNVAERSQSFTHPLWMLLLSAAYFFTREAYFTTLALSFALSLATLLVLATRLARNALAAVAGIAVLTLSKAFVDYSTSGLENVLTFLLLAVFFAVELRVRSPRRKVFTLSLLTALVALNRIDAVLLVAPLFLFALWQERAWLRRNLWQAAALIVLGLLPFVVWEIFSLVYYGFLVPNTAYAKLNTGVPQTELLKHGIWYFIHSTWIDFFTTLCFVACAVVVLWKGSSRTRAIVAGALIYLAYVVWIGGDFMSGRFLAAPLFSVVSAAVMQEWPWQTVHRRSVAAGLAGLIVLGLLAPYSPVWDRRPSDCIQPFPLPTGVVDERACYFPGTGLAVQPPGRTHTPDHGLFAAGLRARSDPLGVDVQGAIGMYGYAAGPGLHVVDLNALADPLLARLPIPEEKPWRIGHYERLIPAGYLETLTSGENRLCNPGIREFYDALSAVTRAPVFAPGRLAAIWKINTGQFDHLLEGYANPDSRDAQLCNASGVVDIQFAGGPKLVGYWVETTEPQPGSKFPITLYWQRGDEHAAPLASFVHVRTSQEGQATNPKSPSGMWAQAENYEPGGRFTPDYCDGQVYTDQFLLDLPADIPAGLYNLEVGWFDAEKGEQLEPRPETVAPPYAILWRSILLPPLAVP
jgi:arabinofuranosyltransferase